MFGATGMRGPAALVLVALCLLPLSSSTRRSGGLKRLTRVPFGPSFTSPPPIPELNRLPEPKSVLQDEETGPDSSPLRVPYFQSPYLMCDTDSDCCPNSSCKWPAKGVRGTTDHKTCIRRGTGFGAVAEAYCKPCVPVTARYRHGRCDPSTAPKHPHHRKPHLDEGSEVGTGSNELSMDDDEESEISKHLTERLPETNVMGEAPYTPLDGDSVDDIARWVMIQRLQNKCDGVEEWCKDQMPQSDEESKEFRQGALRGIMSSQEMKEINAMEKFMGK